MPWRPDTERVSATCVCCSATSWRHYCWAAGYELLRCRSCGFVRLDISEQFDLNSLYGEDYFFGRGFDPASAVIPESRHPGPLLTAKRRYWLRLLSDAIGSPGRLLDVGCGAGALLDVAREMGWRAEGQDISAAGAAEAGSRGHRVQVGELADCEYGQGSFDAAVMIEVIEHLRDPRVTLSALLKVLRPGGWVIIATGDISSLRARIQGRRWGYIRPPGHVSYFTRPSLARLLVSCGFKQVTHMPTYRLAYPSFPGFQPADSPLVKSAALILRRLTRMEQNVMAKA